MILQASWQYRTLSISTICENQRLDKANTHLKKFQNHWVLLNHPHRRDWSFQYELQTSSSLEFSVKETFFLVHLWTWKLHLKGNLAFIRKCKWSYSSQIVCKIQSCLFSNSKDMWYSSWLNWDCRGLNIILQRIGNHSDRWVRIY